MEACGLVLEQKVTGGRVVDVDSCEELFSRSGGVHCAGPGGWEAGGDGGGLDYGVHIFHQTSQGQD